jgi:hypothetical protein
VAALHDLAYRALRHIGEARMSLRRSTLASVTGQKTGRPQFMGIAKVLRLLARQRHQPCLGLQGDCRFPAGARAIIERGHRAFRHGTLDAALDCLMMQSERPTYRKKRRVFPIGQQYPRPLDPACRFRSRLRYRTTLRHLIGDPGLLQRMLPSGDSPSIVVTDRPSTSDTGMAQARVACPSICTVQAPQAAMPQPNLVPVSARCSRSTHVPNVEIKVVSADNPPTGAGEDGVPLVACAVGNAIAALTGVRLHELPFAPEHVRGALGA